MYCFNDQIVVITGAGKGIGMGLAKEFAKLNATVIIVSKSNNCISVSEYLNTLGYKTYSFKVDIRIEKEVKDLFLKINKKFGKVDILVNNAGIISDKYLVNMDENTWDIVLDTNLKGSFLCSKYCGKIMIKQYSGCIINISSVIAISGNFGQTNYCASKAGLIAMTKCLAKEFGTRNIRVNTVSPGLVLTDLTNNLSSSVKSGILSKTILKRFGNIKDISNMVLFIASNNASYITGQNFIVDGGFSIN